MTPSDAECDRVLRELTRPLRGLLSIRVPDDGRLETARLLVSLALKIGVDTVEASNVTKTLSALVALANFSRRLTNNPERKTRFWLSVLASRMMCPKWITKARVRARDATDPLRFGIPLWMLESPEFPAFYIQLALHREVNADLPDALAAFAMPLNEPDDVQIRVDMYVATNQQSLANCYDLLRRLFIYSPDRQFVLQSVRCDWIVARSTQLAIQLELLKNNNSAYQIRELDMRGEALVQLKPERAESELLHELLVATFKLPNLRVPSNALESVHFFTSLRVQQIAAICSSLRYGSSFEKLVLSVSATAGLPPEERQQCWRWIAFGLFHAHSSRLTKSSLSNLRKVAFGIPNMMLADAEAMRRTLHNPLAELAFQINTSPNSKVKMCVVTAGTLVYGSPSRNARSIQTLDEDKELESLGETLDGWLGVVVPYFGLGWIRVARVAVFLDDDYSIESEGADKFELTLWGLYHEAASPQALVCLFECIGAQLNSLIIERGTIAKQYQLVVTAVAEFCVNLKHFVVKDCSVATITMMQLVEALGGDFGRRLVSLNMSDIRFNRYSPMESLTEYLTHPSNLPELEELRLRAMPITAQALANLESALHFRENFFFLELQDCSISAYAQDTILGLKRDEFDAVHQGELLYIKSTLDSSQRAAFLSIICPMDKNAKQHQQHQQFSARYALDSEMISMIFKFAGKAVRRRIAWRNPPR